MKTRKKKGERKRGRRRSLVVVVEVETALIAQIAEEIESKIRRSPSQAACGRETPLSIAMRPCAVLEKGHAWEPERQFF